MMNSSTFNIITKLDPNDVLLGSTYSGNVRFRQLVQERKDKYASSCRRQGKNDLAQEIVNIINERKGRFLREVKDTDEATELGIPLGTQAWIVADNKTILQKVKQAMREPEKDPLSSQNDSTLVNDSAQHTSAVINDQSPNNIGSSNNVGEPGFVFSNEGLRERAMTRESITREEFKSPTATQSPDPTLRNLMINQLLRNQMNSSQNDNMTSEIMQHLHPNLLLASLSSRNLLSPTLTASQHLSNSNISPVALTGHDYRNTELDREILSLRLLLNQEANERSNRNLMANAAAATTSRHDIHNVNSDTASLNDREVSGVLSRDDIIVRLIQQRQVDNLSQELDTLRARQSLTSLSDVSPWLRTSDSAALSSITNSRFNPVLPFPTTNYASLEQANQRRSQSFLLERLQQRMHPLTNQSIQNIRLNNARSERNIEPRNVLELQQQYNMNFGNNRPIGFANNSLLSSNEGQIQSNVATLKSDSDKSTDEEVGVSSTKRKRKKSDGKKLTDRKRQIRKK